MKRLILMRHAKSSWADSDVTDIDRDLGERGRKASDDLGKWFEQDSITPDQVIISSAKRCKETWDLIAKSLSKIPDIVTEPKLYMTTIEGTLDIIKAHASGDSVMLIGHQPTIGQLARALRVDPAPSHEVFDKYPTGATTILELPIDDWSEISLGTAHLEKYVTPKELV